MDSILSTIGKDIYPGLEVMIACRRDTDVLEADSNNERYRIVYIKEGHGFFRNGDRRQFISGPMLLCLSEQDEVSLEDFEGLRMDVLYFNPCGVYSTISYPSIEEWRNIFDHDKFFYRPFHDRNEAYIGAFSTNRYLGNRVSQLIERTDNELNAQRDGFWPCRSRSYYIELLLLVNSVFDEDSPHEKIIVGQMTDEMNELVNWLNVHYEDDITMEDITREFHTNKTTLNKKFKAVMSVTVMEYLINLRMQVACSFLRKTQLTVKEITERAGYRDDSHFLRSFKKFTGFTPSQYRKNHGAV